MQDLTPSDDAPGVLYSLKANQPAVERAVPRSGTAAQGVAPFLDNECGNVPRGTARPAWGRQQWLIRRAVIDRLRYWQGAGYQCLWVTLTSSPNKPHQRLRADFQVLRKRIGRSLGFLGIEYACVDTREGHGVLHMIWSWKDPDPRMRASFYVPFEWLQEQWKEIHGAFHVHVKRVEGSDGDARRLSRYIVAQYCGDQNGLVRFSASKLAYPLPRMREALLRTLKELPERYKQAGALLLGQTPEEFYRIFQRTFWLEFRQAWDSMVRNRSCTAFGVQFVWWCEELQRV